ncbi:MAG TPA: ABC transporter permease [Terriglobia bacterium]|nr:ABC transporter permease [Terriglobia bacterium]
MRRIIALIVKEMLLLWKDRRMRFVIILPPLIQVVIFAHAATFEVRHVPLAVWNEDQTEDSREFVRRFTDSDAFDLVANLDNPQAVTDWINAQRAGAVLHIDARFSADLASSRPAKVQMIIDGRRSNVALIVQNYAATIVESYNRERLGAAGSTALAGPRLEVRAWFNPNLESQWYILPALNALLVMVMAMLITALSVARERELGTFDQLLVTPLRPLEILIGKVTPSLIIALGEAFGILAVAVFAFDVPFRGSLAWFGVSFVVFLLSAIGIGLAISAVAKTQQQAILAVFIFLAPAIILSGMATPIDNMPDWCQKLSLINPTRYMVELIRSLYLRDPAPALIIQQLWPMLLIGAITLSFATLLFRRRLG